MPPTAVIVARMSALLVTWLLAPCGAVQAQVLGVASTRPNLERGIERPMRYRPDGSDFVIEDGAERFNRPLYGGNTAFRVDGGDEPEFVLYLPGRGGNLRLGVSSPAGMRWLHDAARVATRYRPGALHYEIRDPMLGPDGVMRLAAMAYHQTEGLVLRAEAEGIPDGIELVWAYGGVNGQRGTRDGDIGTESVPISQWFQLRPEFTRDNRFELLDGRFTLRAPAATIVGVVPPGARLSLGEAADWGEPSALFAVRNGPPANPVVVGRARLESRRPLFLSLQRVAPSAAAPRGTETSPAVAEPAAGTARPLPTWGLVAPYEAVSLPSLFEATERHFAALRSRVSVETPDPYLNAAMGALNVAADAVWDAPQEAIMHGAIAWRTRLLGWRGPYLLDALGWHDRAVRHYTYWAGRQNTSPVPSTLPPPDENANLARSEAALHSNGDLSNSHYDMNLVYVDALFRHLEWTGDLALARTLWPTIERHLAWERRLFRREFGPRRLPLYEAYAAIWASDDLGYNGGGTTHASAYNYFHNVQAARLARLLGHDPTPYAREAALIAQGMRSQLWLPGGGFAEYRDLLGLKRLHASAGLWTFYHALDAELPTPREAWAMTEKVVAESPRLPVRGPGVPEGLFTLATTDWMPYSWSINNVVMGEAVHAALGFWQAGRADDAWRLMKGSLLAAMFMGIAPGNVGSMSYLDVYRRESQRDFADGSGVLSRAIVEGLFGIRPDALAGELHVEPGFPAEWTRASIAHPDITLRFSSDADATRYLVEQRFAQPQRLRLRLAAPLDRVVGVTVNGSPARWRPVAEAVNAPRIEIVAPAAARHEVVVRWAGGRPRPGREDGAGAGFVRVAQGQMQWWSPRSRARPWPAGREPAAERSVASRLADGGTPRFETLDLSTAFNDRVTQIFRNEYRAPRSPHVSLATPKQGIGAWAGHVNETAVIDDSGLRAAAAAGRGRIVLPNGVPLATPSAPGARNVAFTSRWENYPREVAVSVGGRARRLVLLMAGSTNHMQSRIDNGEVVVRYADGTSDRLPLENPTTWWPIEKDYFVDDFQFRRPGPLPIRVDLATGRIRVLDMTSFKGAGRAIAGGAATVLELPLQPSKPLRSITVRALSNEVVIGMMAATLVR